MPLSSSSGVIPFILPNLFVAKEYTVAIATRDKTTCNVKKNLLNIIISINIVQNIAPRVCSPPPL
jgi:hypothetical protein